MHWLAELMELVSGFMRTGGPILWVIAVVLLLMWALIIERFMYLGVAFPRFSRRVIAKWDARSDTTSWYAHRIREAWISQANALATQNIMAIKTLVAICPLVGLLGTVLGMINVFETMAMVGSSNPRLMADGISMATVPTMAGMVAALSGLFVSTQIEANAKNKMDHLIDHMPHH
ncbi:MAG TPA: MotA/TolQ/ExbB proton channel family protein [Aeromonadales bacterium]|nr:MotA/TolQ/ExbB proton channel family protein [Aeromonadales bacterium]